MNRLVQPEILDTLPPDDPRAIRSRRDLRRVNAWMGNVGIIANALNEKWGNRSGGWQTAAVQKNDSSGFLPKAATQITELGAGDGNFLLRVAKKLNWQNVKANLLDRQKNISPETLAAFASLGWRAEAVVADVFDWPQTSGGDEAVIANLFLHHFEDARLAELLRNISQRASLFIAVEPHRFRYAFPCAQLLRFIGCSGVTLHDAAVSIRAGFIHQEISALWPDKQNWQLTERRAGLFSHLFIAQKRAAGLLPAENRPADKMPAAG